MKDGLKQTIGKQIVEVVVAAKNSGEPRNQVFLIFSDGTYFEFWGHHFSCAGGVDRGSTEQAISYAERGGAEITAIYSPPG